MGAAVELATFGVISNFLKSSFDSGLLQVKVVCELQQLICSFIKFVIAEVLKSVLFFP